MVPTGRHGRHWRSYLAGRGLVIKQPIRVKRALTVLSPVLVGIFVSGAVFVGAENEIAPQFRKCVGEYYSQQAAGGSDNSRLVVLKGVFIQTVCTVSLIDRHNGFFGVLGTAVLAAFTGTLWWSTDKLWRADQSRQAETDRLLIATEASAKAASAQAEVSQKALIASNRPHLIIQRHFEPDESIFKNDNSFAVFRFSYQNKGASVAIFDGYWASYDYQTELAAEQLIPGCVVYKHYFFVEPGQGSIIYKMAIDKPPAALLQDVFDRKLTLYVYGGCSYEGLSTSRHETRFCWQYVPEEDRFHQTHSDIMNRRT